MAGSGDWEVVFYVAADGDGPVRGFLADLDRQTAARFDWSIEQLRLRNVLAREPLVRRLEGGVWELRRESNTNIYRLLYALLPRRRILFLHGFQKKSRKTPRREIETALRRLADFRQREGGD